MQLIVQEVTERRQSLQPVDDDLLTFLIFSEIENGEGNPHQHGFDKLALLPDIPDTLGLALGIGGHNKFPGPNHANHLNGRSRLGPN
ncbi:MAG: hypothetical protein NTW75_00155 [Planctomycetales bacterium]|nr:hypothetical protein [Planctomycetales bacterium]